MKRILVTGATGFIGSYLIPELLRAGHQVIATSAHEARARLQPWFPQVVYLPCDLSRLNPDLDYFREFGQPDSAIHLAWEGLPNYKASFHEEVNLPRQYAFLTRLINGGLRDLTVLGTCLEYGMREGCLSEAMQAAPTIPYAKAKDTLRRQLEAYRGRHPFVFRWVRLFYMYGRGQNPNSLFSQLDKAVADHEPVFNMSGGEQVRDYLPVESVAVYLIKLANQDRVVDIINCCSGEPVTVKQMVEAHLRRSGAEIALNLGYYPYPDYEPFRFWGDPSKLKTILENE
ncbi:MAG TPA: NAD(P)-dependent oxidoreductase [Puia sp.]|nr:NAD(P)-dependent oxidoreductase [Puia sp.]